MEIMSQLTGMFDKVYAPFRWVDRADPGRQKVFRVAMVGLGMIAIGAVVMSAMLFSAHVIGPGGSPENFSFSTLIPFLIGTGLMGAGLGFMMSMGIDQLEVRKRKIIQSFFKVIGLTAVSALAIVVCAIVFRHGFAKGFFNMGGVMASIFAVGTASAVYVSLRKSEDSKVIDEINGTYSNRKILAENSLEARRARRKREYGSV
ncbi:MAG: hypothetical protein S4CHLAM45_14480 [Chlamydiales bacterium]|nr:hypothetical protein [Chlamydiales bacterium]MCH9620043.1 hypothetical protein [Chlamydiales bacterium]MCH9623538.1 hypothetical protein [Chlamydiales bacterium]